MAAIVTTNLRIFAANTFLSTFDGDSQNVYLFIGNCLPWSNENSPPTPIDCESNFNSVFANMMSLKLISSGNVSLVIPRNNWTSGTPYASYSNLIDLFDPNNPLIFFVITSQLNVYMCLNNNNGALSTVQPTGTSTNVLTVSDGYTWKYMYTLAPTNVVTFATDEWIPVATLTENDGSNQWLVQQAAIPGTIDRIDMVTQGTQYTSIPTVTIVGDGTGATAVATINGGNVIGITVTDAGVNYTYATVNITGGGVGANGATANAILSPFAGHGYDPVTELGGFFVMVSQTLDGSENGFFTVQNDYRVLGLIQNPVLNGTDTLATASVLSQAFALTLTSTSGTLFNPDETVTGSISGATGIVEDWDGTSLLRLVQVFGTFEPGETIIGSDMSGVLLTVTGTAQNGTTTSINLANSASSINNFYVGQTILITGGTGSGQSRIITSYTGLTRTAFVFPNFTVAPDNTSAYVVASIVKPAIAQYQGKILYLENRRPIARSTDQSESTRIVIQF